MPIYYLAVLLCMLFACQGKDATVPPASSPTFRPQVLTIDNNEACSIVDINRDGLPDIVAGRMWYAAPDFVPRPVRPIALHGLDYAQNNGEYIWDVNQDGWPDVVATGWGDGRIQWFQNPGKEGLEMGLQWKAHTLADTKITRSEAGFMQDLDGDGVPEYIMNSWNEETPFSIWRFEKDVAGMPVMIGTTIGVRNGHGVGFGDMNNDGRTDILMDEGWYEQPATDIWAGSWPLHRDWLLNDGSCPMQVVDLNEDGRKDVIWGRGHNYGLYWLEQGESIGDSTTWTQHLIDDSWSQVHALTWADLDGDGKAELLAGKRIRAHSGNDPGSSEPAHLYRYSWNTTNQSFDRQIISEGKIGSGLFIRTGDLNQDGRPEIVVAGKTGTYILWQE